METYFNFDFGDKRLVKRGNDLITGMQKKNSVILRKIANNWSEEVAYGRFLNNEKVTMDSLIAQATHIEESDIEGRHVLILQDSSELNYDSKKMRISNLGKIGTSKTNGFEIHPNLAIDAVNGAIYGITDIYTWKRTEVKRNSTQRAKAPYWEKESGRWVSCGRRSLSRCKRAAVRTVICDREADSYDMFHNIPDTSSEDYLLIRSSQDRLLYQRKQKLFEFSDSLPVTGSYTLDLPKTDKRSAHQALLEVRFERVRICKPSGHWDKNAPEFIELSYVDVREHPDSVVNNEEPVHWRLFTTHLVDSFDAARLIIDWYCMRWWIEQLFRTLKNKGLRVEDSQVEDYDRLVKLIVLAIMASVRSLQLTKARDGDTTQQLTTVFTEQEAVLLRILSKKHEGKTAKLKNPYPESSLAFGAWVIARLGGWKGYKSQTPPGPITMYDGLKKFSDIYEGFKLL